MSHATYSCEGVSNSCFLQVNVLPCFTPQAPTLVRSTCLNVFQWASSRISFAQLLKTICESRPVWVRPSYLENALIEHTQMKQMYIGEQQLKQMQSGQRSWSGCNWGAAAEASTAAFADSRVINCFKLDYVYTHTHWTRMPLYINNLLSSQQSIQ